MKMYNQLSTDEIMYDIVNNSSENIPLPLRLAAKQYVGQRVSRYQIERVNCIDQFAATALDNDDYRRVNELLSVGTNTSTWALNEFAMYKHFSRPYIVPEVVYNQDISTITLKLSWTGVRMPMTHNIKQLLEIISTPMDYRPSLVEVHGSPEISHALSKMLGMEIEPLEKTCLRYVGDKWLSLDHGFCNKSLNTYGGVISIPGIDYVTLVKELVLRSPLKTLIVVETNTLPMWKEFARWHGARRDNDLVVVTTRSTLIRCWTSLNGFHRLICTSIPNIGTVYNNVISSMPCKIRWAFCQREAITGFNVLGIPYDSRACVSLTRLEMEQMGVLFPMKVVQRVICNVKHGQEHVLKNIQSLAFLKRKEMMSKYLLRPSLVPPQIRGEKLDSYKGTLESISSNFKIPKETLQGRVKETCAVCLETISDPAVTPCGHVFCAECATELDKRNINCALCRAKVKGYMRVSDEDTPGKVVMHGGSCYRVDADDSWGAKYSLLKEHTDATFITQYGSVKRELQKAFPKIPVVTRRAIDNGLRVETQKIVMIEPDPLPDFDYAWGQDLEIIQLSYTVRI